MVVGGAGKQLALTANALSNKGHRVEIFTYFGGPLEHKLEDSVRYIAQNPIPKGKIAEYLLSAFNIRRQIKKSNPDIVISWRCNAGCFAVLASIGLNVKLVFSERSDPFLETSLALKISAFICGFSDGGVFQLERVRQYYKRLYNKSIVIHNPIDENIKISNTIPYNKRSKKIFTVSDFSKSEIQNFFKLPQTKIIDIGNGWQHIETIKTDEDSITKYGLFKKKYFFSLGTKAPHKNLNWVFDYAQKHLDEVFVISGFTNNSIYGKVGVSMPSNVRFLGYLRDSEVKSLMQNCKAFLFPSFYEGFGIPPLEAMSTGCPVIVSDIPVMHEIFEDSVHYIDPNNTDVNLEALLKQSVSPATPILEKYSWQKSAKKLLESLGVC